MKIHRFYTETLLDEENSQTLSITDEHLIHQWRNVLRFTPGEVIDLFTKEGVTLRVKLQELTRGLSTWEIIKKTQTQIKQPRTCLYMSLIKKDTFELVTQKVSEIGIKKIIPIITARTQNKNLNQERLEKIILEATEQSGGFNPLEQGDLTSLESAIISANTLGEKIILLEFNSPHVSNLTEDLPKDTPVALFIGPEGGWSDEDKNIFEKYEITRISLGEKIFRAETAAIVSCWELEK